MNDHLNIIDNIDPDENYFDHIFPSINASEQSKYFTSSQFNSLCLQYPNSITILNFNIRSFTKNSNLLFASFDPNFIPEILVLTETWFTDNNIQNIPGYNSYHTLRIGRSSGGVSIYVKDSFISSKIVELCISNLSIELCAVEVVIGGESWCLLGIYRPHSDSPENFTYMIEQILQNNKLRNKNCIILGDINLNLLLENSAVDEFVATMRSHHYIPTITKPTWFPPNNDERQASLLDHIWLNKPINYSSGVILNDITDHCQTFIRWRVNNH